MNCDDLKLSLYADGELAERAEMEKHLAGCEKCRTRLDQFMRADAFLARAADRMAPPIQKPVVIPRHTVRKPWWPRLAAVAAVILLGFGGLLTYVNVRTASPQEVRVIGGAQMVAGGKARYRVLVTDHRTGSPVANATIQAILQAEGNRELGRTNVVSDAQGSAEVDFDVPDLPEQMTFISLDVGSPLGRDTLFERASIIRPARMLLSTDKPIYQPTQTIHIRALVMNNITMKPLAKQPVSLEVEDPEGNKVFRRELRSSDFGIVAADFQLADQVTLGRYRITTRAGRKVEGERIVEVKRYALPKFGISLKTDQAFYAPEDILKGTIEAAYFFEKPVAGGRAKIELSQWMGNEFRVFHTIEKRLDMKGREIFEAKLPREFYGLNRDDVAVVRIESTVTDSGNHAETRVVALPISRSPLRLTVVPQHGDIVAGIENSIYVVAAYPDGRAARCKVNGIETDEAGVATLSLGSSLDEVIILAHDSEGHDARVLFQPRGYLGSGDFALVLDRASYRAGETASVTVLAAFESGTVYLDLVKSGQTLLTRALEVRDHRGRLPVDLPAELFGTIHLTAYRLRGDGTMSRDAKVFVVDLPGDLKIRPKMSKVSYRPGEEVKVDFELLDSQGRPAPGAISLAIVDPSVFAKAEARPGLEKEYFKIQEDLLEPRYQLKACETLTGTRVTQVRCCISERPEITILGRVEYAFKQGHYERFAHSFNERVLQAIFILCLIAILVGTGVALSRGRKALLPLGCAWAFGIILLFVLAALYLPHISLLQNIGIGKKAVTSRMDSGSTSPPGPPVETSMMDNRASRAAPHVREFFPETLYWNPEIVTDEKGKATITFQAADSITTWKMAMSAVTRDGQLGAGEEGLRVFQPFFVDIDLPATLTQGDEIWLPVTVYNYLKEPQTVDLSFTAESGFELVGGAKKEVAIAANEVLPVTFHIKATKPGRHKLRVDARGGLVADIIRREIEVLPDGKESPFSKSERLEKETHLTFDIPAAALDGVTKARLRLFPSTFSDVVTGLDRLVRMPYG